MTPTIRQVCVITIESHTTFLVATDCPCEDTLSWRSLCWYVAVRPVVFYQTLDSYAFHCHQHQVVNLFFLQHRVIFFCSLVAYFCNATWKLCSVWSLIIYLEFWTISTRMITTAPDTNFSTPLLESLVANLCHRLHLTGLDWDLIDKFKLEDWKILTIKCHVRMSRPEFRRPKTGKHVKL